MIQQQILQWMETDSIRMLYLNIASFGRKVEQCFTLVYESLHACS